MKEHITEVEAEGTARAMEVRKSVTGTYFPKNKEKSDQENKEGDPVKIYMKNHELMHKLVEGGRRFHELKRSAGIKEVEPFRITILDREELERKKREAGDMVKRSQGIQTDDEAQEGRKRVRELRRTIKK